MKNINYSFIIPHKNSIICLQRCIDSIPKRNDIQIIVVDDNSNIDDYTWKNFKKKNTRVDVILEKESGGAGAARNIGLKSHPKGKWILFADADDYYNPGFIDVLDKYKEFDLDVLYFNADSLDSKTGVISDIISILHKKIIEKDENYIRYKFYAPWNKMLSMNFLKSHKIFFEEVHQGNDVFFSIQVGFYAKRISIISNSLYTYIINYNGISQTVSWNYSQLENCFLRLFNLNDIYQNVEHANLNEFSTFSFFKGKLMENRKDIRNIIKVVFCFFTGYLKYLFFPRRRYINIIKNHD